MNRMYTLMSVLIALSGLSYANTTNYVGDGTEEFNYLNLQFTGGIGEISADISRIDSLYSTNTSFTGGAGNSTGTTADGATALLLDDINLTRLSNAGLLTYAAEGGSGGNPTSTVSGVTGNVSASGGSGVSLNVGTSGDNIYGTQRLEASDTKILGGSGGSILGKESNYLYANGGSGIYIEDSILHLENSVIDGGAGGQIHVSDSYSSESYVNGGHGIHGAYESQLSGLQSGVEIRGGNGGTISHTTQGGEAFANGGKGVSYDDYLGTAYGLLLNINNGKYVGGNGGTITNGSTSEAKGGIGFAANLQNINISEGLFEGGSGGVVTNSTGTGSAIATGGDGFFILLSAVTISNGVFKGGKGGLVNGISEDDGYGFKSISSTLIIEDGTFEGEQGLMVENYAGDSTTTINGGVFDSISFLSQESSTTPALFHKNDVIINGGSLGDIILDGIYLNNIIINGGAFNDLLLYGSGTNNLAFTSNIISSGIVEMHDGVANISGWSDSNFVNTVISAGEMNFTGQAFNLQDGGIFTLETTNSMASFNDGLIVGSSTFNVNDGSVNASDILLSSGSVLNIDSGQIDSSDILLSSGSVLNIENGLIHGSNMVVEGSATLNVNEGSVISTNFVAKDGANLHTAFNGASAGLITGENLSFSNVNWSLSGETTLTDGTVTLAESTTTNLTVEDINWDSTVVNTSSWLTIVTDVYADSYQFIYAQIGEASLDQAIGIDSDSNYGKALADFSAGTAKDSEAWSIVTGYPTSADADEALYPVLMERNEMASMLIRENELITDQIKGRTRSYTRHKKYGTSYSLPQGAAGPEDWEPDTWYNTAKDAVHGRTPEINMEGSPADVNRPYMSSKTKAEGNVYESFSGWVNGLFPEEDPDISGAMRTIEERSMPAVGDVVLAPSYQMWGNVFGSWYEQKATDGFAGYDAQIYGAIIGADRRFDNMMVGFGGGFSDTALDGNAGHNGDSLTGFGTVYAAYTKDNAFFDLNANYGFSSVENQSISDFNYSGKYDASSVGLYVGGGYDMGFFDKGIYNLLVTPELSLLTTFYSQDSYDETSSVGGATKAWDSYDQMSYLSSLGLTLSKMHKIQSYKMEMEFRPELRAHWLHEFNPDMDAQTYQIVGGVNTIGVALQPREEDLLKVGAGVRFNSWHSDTLEFGVDIDGTFGSDYTAYILSGSLLHRF